MRISKTVYGHLGACVLLILLSIWSWNKWHSVWIERSEGFFPPEFGQVHDLEELAWRYPVYRSNDSYQWVAIANALADGDGTRLTHNTSEGPHETGRANAWHSGLARYLQIGGNFIASWKDWPSERGIGQFAHWAGTPLHFAGLILGALLLYRLAGGAASLAFLALYFFSPGISWEFHFSRIDHESCLQLAVLLQALGLVGCVTQRSLGWGIIAGIGSGLGWWIGATPQAIVGVVLLLAVLLQVTRGELTASGKSLLVWGISGSITLLFLGTLDERWSHSYGLSAWHPVYALAQLGCGLLAYSIANKNRIGIGAALLLGLSPLLLLATKGVESHVWLDPLMRRIHAFIVEFQSPLANGTWTQWTSVSTLLCALLALAGLIGSRLPYRFFLIALIVGGLALSLFQSRWMGLSASLSILSICLSLPSKRVWLSIASGTFAAVLAISWMASWVRIEEKPGKLFVADLFLQAGARDICLNLDYQLVRNQRLDSVVALPYGFAPAAALFESVHPLGSFYWENQQGLETASKLFASVDESTAQTLCREQSISYIVVQRMQLGEPFANLAHAAVEAPHAVEATLAWRLSHGVDVPEWCTEVPFYGTFDPSRFSVRIYSVR